MGINKIVHGNKIKTGTEFLPENNLSKGGKNNDEGKQREDHQPKGVIATIALLVLRHNHTIESHRNKKKGKNNRVKAKANCEDLYDIHKGNVIHPTQPQKIATNEEFTQQEKDSGHRDTRPKKV
jgi:hypothetical protein